MYTAFTISSLNVLIINEVSDPCNDISQLISDPAQLVHIPPILTTLRLQINAY